MKFQMKLAVPLKVKHLINFDRNKNSSDRFTEVTEGLGGSLPIIKCGLCEPEGTS